jgi:hypothetical protein
VETSRRAVIVPARRFLTKTPGAFEAIFGTIGGIIRMGSVWFAIFPVNPACQLAVFSSKLPSMEAE